MNRTEIIAAACHSAWYAFTVLGLGEPGETWSAAPEWQRSSIRHAVAFWDALPDDLPFEKVCAASHVSWMNHKTREGWVWGPVKDAEKKEHPCMVAYEELPPEQRKKDAVVVSAFLELKKLLPTA